MTHNQYPPANRERHGLTVVTPGWLKARRAAVASLSAERAASEQADTTLIILAAQHPLDVGRFPGAEYSVRLENALQKYKATTDAGRKAKFFLPGNRHHDSESGRTDRTALYDVAGR